MRFQTSVAGTVSGIRFYKSSQDTGTHTGELWTSTGTRLATATFTNETASGWQSVNFLQPGHVDAGRDLCRLLSHECGPLLQPPELLHEQCDKRSTDRSRQRQWRLYLQQQQRVPDKHVLGDELLG